MLDTAENLTRNIGDRNNKTDLSEVKTAKNRYIDQADTTSA